MTHKGLLEASANSTERGRHTKAAWKQTRTREIGDRIQFTLTLTTRQREENGKIYILRGQLMYLAHISVVIYLAVVKIGHFKLIILNIWTTARSWETFQSSDPKIGAYLYIFLLMYICMFRRQSDKIWYKNCNMKQYLKVCGVCHC